MKVSFCTLKQNSIRCIKTNLVILLFFLKSGALANSEKTRDISQIKGAGDISFANIRSHIGLDQVYSGQIQNREGTDYTCDLKIEKIETVENSNEVNPSITTLRAKVTLRQNSLTVGTSSNAHDKSLEFKQTTGDINSPNGNFLVFQSIPVSKQENMSAPVVINRLHLSENGWEVRVLTRSSKGLIAISTPDWSGKFNTAMVCAGPW